MALLKHLSFYKPLNKRMAVFDSYLLSVGIGYGERREMNQTAIVGIAVVALVLSVGALGAAFLMNPESSIGAGSIDTDHLSDDAVTSSKVLDGTLTDDDVSTEGLSKIADDAIGSDHIGAAQILLAHLSSEVLSEMSGVVDLLNNSITGDKIADGTITGADLAINLINSASIIDLSVQTSDLADDAVTTSKIADETITADDVLDHTQILSFCANALNYDDDAAPIIQDSSRGLVWQQDWSRSVSLCLQQPLYWDLESNVTMHLYFKSNNTANGDVQFFIRPRAYDMGDSYSDSGSISGDVVSVTAGNTIYKQSIEIPATSFGSEELWFITIQRQGSSSTYTDDVVLMSVALEYTAMW